MTENKEKNNRENSGFFNRFSNAAANLFPGYFALVMATGIVSNASFFLGFQTIARALLYLNAFAYVVLWAFLLFRLVRYFPRIVADLDNHARGPGFFTVSAGSSVLGTQLMIVAGYTAPAILLWFVALAVWLIVIYSFMTVITVRVDKPPLEKGINGTWLLLTVATQGVAVLGAMIAPNFGEYQDVVLFFSLGMFLLGAMIYIPLITLIFYRFTFLSLSTQDLTPPYWINMGAVAITTLAGSKLILSSNELFILQKILPFLQGFTIFFWAWGTWWIPLLLLLGFWRHGVKRFPLRYDPQYWGMVFPLGMYTACTFQLSKALEYERLMAIPRVFIYVAIAAWIVVFAGMVISFFKRES
ncbi:MAG: tellurite resistance/C4-dicarboxylate transporter family protein [Pyrinomonadaceae bacterium]